jgi:hypothetical protein
MEDGFVLGVAGLVGASIALPFLLPGLVSMSELTFASKAKGSPSFFSGSSASSKDSGRPVLRELGGCHGAGPDGVGLRCCR